VRTTGVATDDASWPATGVKPPGASAAETPAHAEPASNARREKT
jgi:hypothetical protein